VTQRTNVRGTQLAWHWQSESEETDRDRAPIVWAHGGNSSRADEDAAGFLNFDRWPSQSARRVLRYDARGHGESGDGDPAAYKWDELARDQLALTEAIGIDRYVAAGRSLGLATALHAAVLAPDRIERLVLMNPPTAWEARDAQADGYLAMADLVDSEGTGFLVEGAAAWPLPNPLVGQSRISKQRAINMGNRDAARLATFFRGTAGTNLPDREAIATIDVPALILAWTGDTVHPVEASEELTGLLPDTTLHIAATWDDLQRWTDVIADFVG